jgi:hypothetical protein
MPYLSAKIMLRLAEAGVPGIAKAVRAEGGRTRLTRWTRRLTFGLAVVQSYGFARFVETIPGVVLHPGPVFIAQTMAALTAGAMCVAWLSEDLLAPHETSLTTSDDGAAVPILPPPSPDVSPFGRRESAADAVKR